MDDHDSDRPPYWTAPNSPASESDRPPRGDPRRRTWLPPDEVELEYPSAKAGHVDDRPGAQHLEALQRLRQPEEVEPQPLGDILEPIVLQLEVQHREEVLRAQ